jgi:hypothetical protein
VALLLLFFIFNRYMDKLIYPLSALLYLKMKSMARSPKRPTKEGEGAGGEGGEAGQKESKETEEAIDFLMDKLPFLPELAKLFLVLILRYPFPPTSSSLLSPLSSLLPSSLLPTHFLFPLPPPLH